MTFKIKNVNQVNIHALHVDIIHKSTPFNVVCHNVRHEKLMTYESIHISQLLNDKLRCGFQYLVRQYFRIHKFKKRFAIPTRKIRKEIFEFKKIPLF